MQKYWLNCEKCNKDYDFNEITDSNSIASYLWYKFFETDSDQTLLSIKCPNCGGNLLFTYYLSKDAEAKSDSPWKVRHIVYVESNDSYYPMLWETFQKDKTDVVKYDFKYLNGNNPYGLNHPPIMDESELKTLIELFNTKCHRLLR